MIESTRAACGACAIDRCEIITAHGPGVASDLLRGGLGGLSGGQHPLRPRRGGTFIKGSWDLAGRSVFDLSVCGRPGGSEEAGGREKTKTGKQGPGGGPGAPRVLRPSAKVG